MIIVENVTKGRKYPWALVCVNGHHEYVNFVSKEEFIEKFNEVGTDNVYESDNHCYHLLFEDKEEYQAWWGTFLCVMILNIHAIKRF